MRNLGTVGEVMETLGMPIDDLPGWVLSAPIRVNPRLVSTIGKAVEYLEGPRRGQVEVQLNGRIGWGRAGLVEVLAHEVAHLVAGFDAGHNSAWRRRCRTLGGSGARTISARFARARGYFETRIDRPQDSWSNAEEVIEVARWGVAMIENSEGARDGK